MIRGTLILAPLREQGSSALVLAAEPQAICRRERRARHSAASLGLVEAAGAALAEGAKALGGLELEQQVLEGSGGPRGDVFGEVEEEGGGAGLVGDGAAGVGETTMDDAAVVGVGDLVDEAALLEGLEGLADGALGDGEIIGQGVGRVAVAVGHGEVDEGLELHELEVVLGGGLAEAAAEERGEPLEELVQTSPGGLGSAAGGSLAGDHGSMIASRK